MVKKAAARKPTAAQRSKMKGRFEMVNGVLSYQPVMRRLAFLFGDGSSIVVTAPRDDSDLRGDLLIEAGQERIAGVADLTDES